MEESNVGGVETAAIVVGHLGVVDDDDAWGRILHLLFHVDGLGWLQFI
jgi:hypothetical protein